MANTLRGTLDGLRNLYDQADHEVRLFKKEQAEHRQHQREGLLTNLHTFSSGVTTRSRHIFTPNEDNFLNYALEAYDLATAVRAHNIFLNSPNLRLYSDNVEASLAHYPLEGLGALRVDNIVTELRGLLTLRQNYSNFIINSEHHRIMNYNYQNTVINA